MTSGPGAGEQTVSVKSSGMAGLRSRIEALAADLGTPGEPGYLDAAESLVATGVELVRAEERIRERKRAKRRRHNAVASTVCGSLLSLESVGLGVVTLIGHHSLIWLLLIAAMFFCGLVIFINGLTTKPDEKHPSFWPGTICAAGAGALTPLIIFHVIAGGFSGLAVPLAFTAIGMFVPDTTGQAESKATEPVADADADSEVHDAIPENAQAAESSDVPGTAVDPHAAGLAEHVHLLESQVASLSSTIARAGLAPQADLDVVDPQDAALIAQVMRGREARNQLISNAERAAKLAMLSESAHANLDRLDTVATAVEAAKAVGRTRPRDTDYKQAAADLLEAREAVERANALCMRLTVQATRSADELKADDATAAEMIDVLDAGVAAHRRLAAKVRARLIDEVERGSVLPAWFLRAFGPTPPTRSPDPDLWYSLAAEVLAYRIIYGVRADDTALGARPPSSDDARLCDFDALEESVRSHRWV